MTRIKFLWTFIIRECIDVEELVVSFAADAVFAAVLIGYAVTRW